MEASDYSSKQKRALLVVNRWLDSWAGQLFLVAATAAAYVYAYQHHPARPGANAAYPLGWLGWWDQGQYWKCAATLAHGGLTQDSYWYPLGYPALGALFYRLTPSHSFLFPDLVLVVGSAILFYHIARKFMTSVEATLLLVVFSICYREILSFSLVEPWNTIPTIFLTYALILFVGLHEPGRKAVFVGAACVGLMYLCRPPDAACLGLILVVVILRSRSWSEKIKLGIAATVILSIAVGSILLINRSVFGSWRTPYEMISAGIGFNSFSFAQKAFALIIDAKPFFRLGDTALLLHFPWLVLLPPGVVYFIRRYKWGAVGVLLSIAATYAVYFAYNDFWPGNMFRYHLIHYLFWTFPILALFVYVGLREAWKDRIGRFSCVLILPILVPICFLTLKENVLGRITPPLSDKLILPPAGASKVDWILLVGAETKSDPFRSEFNLTAFQDFITIGRNDGRLTLLANRARRRAITIEPADAAESKTVVYGTLDWSLRWPPRPLERRPSRALEVVLRRTEQGLDVTGPQGVPDGRADQVIEVRLDEEFRRTIAAWEIETTDYHGHWLTNANLNGWWLIKVDPLPPTDTQPHRVGLRLIFPDYGDFERAPGFVLRATDIDGNLLIDQTIQK
jgi:hypothetical protein